MISVKYGRSNANGANGDTALARGKLTTGESATLDLDEGMYVLYTMETTRSSGAVRGHRAIMIAVTNSTFTRGNMFASTNSGVTLTNDTTNRTLTITPSSASYDVEFALYAV